MLESSINAQSKAAILDLELQVNKARTVEQQLPVSMLLCHYNSVIESSQYAKKHHGVRDQLACG